MGSYFRFGPVVQGEMSFTEKVYQRTDDGQRPITIAHLEPNKRAYGPWIAHLNPCHKERMLTTKYKSHFSNIRQNSDHNQAY